jgi:hypothetical protein
VYQLREVCELMEPLAKITIRARGQPDAAASVSGTSRRVLGLPPSLGHGQPSDPLCPGTSLLLGCSLVHCWFVLARLANLEYLAERGLLYLDGDRLAGNRGHRCARRAAFLVDRRNGVETNQEKRWSWPNAVRQAA